MFSHRFHPSFTPPFHPNSSVISPFGVNVGRGWRLDVGHGHLGFLLFLVVLGLALFLMWKTRKRK